MAASIFIERTIETAARLTHLIEPAHRIAHGWPRSEVDDRRGAAAAGLRAHARLHVDPQNLRTSCNGTVTA
jgi:hypothetical protein